MSLRRRLQRETADIHALLDALASERGWFGNVASYGSWLRGMHAFHGQIVDELSGIDLGGMFDTGRIERLALDLQDLGVEPLARRHAVVGGTTDRQTALGILYVTEGAKLGARILLKRAETMGCSADHGARFLTAEAHGFGTWHAVLAGLEAVVLDQTEMCRLVSASVRTFNLAVECLDGLRGK